jgi:hypothetical protein
MHGLRNKLLGHCWSSSRDRSFSFCFRSLLHCGTSPFLVTSKKYRSGKDTFGHYPTPKTRLMPKVLKSMDFSRSLQVACNDRQPGL